MTLARATATASGTLGAHGELVPLFEDELVYVMTWPRTICAGGGGMPVFAPAESPSGAVRSRGPGAPDTTTGTAITYVDAASPGHMLFAACGPG